MRSIRPILLATAACLVTFLAASVLAQREKPAEPAPAKADPPTVVGQVVAYEPGTSIAVESRNRKGVTKSEFAIRKDETKIELPPRAAEIKVGMTLAIWADKDDPKTAARIGTQTNNPAQPRRRPNNRPAADAATARGQVAVFEADKSITVEFKQRGGKTGKAEFSIVKDQTKIELAGDAKAIAVGMPVSVWADKNDPKLAARIVAGASAPLPRVRRPNPNPDQTRSTPPVVPARPIVNRPPRPPVAGLDPPAVARQIDQQIQARLEADRIPASPPCDDAEFLRRVYLDITGVIPPADKAAAFLDSSDSGKRAKLIDELLASEDYGWHFADLWCDLINIKDLPIYREPFTTWMSESLNAGRGWDEIVLELLTAEGSFNFVTRGKRLGSSDPQALFVLVNTEEGMNKGPNPAWLAAESGRLFLGVQIQCAECHDHPFTESWKQTDFWGLAALFGQFRSQRDNEGLRWIETPAASDAPVSVAIPPTALKNVGQIVPARLLGAEADYQPGDQQLLRHSLARWITAADNPLFARAAANRTWAHFLGRGLVNPVDDLRADNPPSHPEVLQLLAGELRKSQFDLKHLIRCICLSAAYQRTSAPLAENEQDQERYSHMAVKIMSPGVFYDSLKAATLWPELKVGLPERKTKLTVATLFTPREVFVDFFRSSQGEEAQPLENTHGIPQALKLMNAAQLNRVAPVVERLAGSDQGRQPIIEQLYLAALARRPSAEETRLMAEFLDQRQDASASEGYSAVLWALINSAEFVSVR